jgi:ADP-L-glycero-D-manno-heptose 6-epimerase
MILLTGDMGFIGGEIAKKLKETNKEFHGIDRKRGDVFEQLNDAPWEKITRVIHQGAITNTSEQDVGLINKYNIDFSIELFTKAQKLNLPVTYASSAAYFGDIKQHGWQPIPLNFYALSKLTVDYWVEDRIDSFNNIVGFRYYNVYGRDESMKMENSQSPLYKFAKQAQETGVIEIFYGSETALRDFVCVDDIVEIVLHEDNDKGIFDLGTGVQHSFLTIAQMMAAKYNATIRFINFPRHLMYKYQTYTKARDHVNYNFTKLEDWVFSQ